MFGIISVNAKLNNVMFLNWQLTKNEETIIPDLDETLCNQEAVRLMVKLTSSNFSGHYKGIFNDKMPFEIQFLSVKTAFWMAFSH